MARRKRRTRTVTTRGGRGVSGGSIWDQFHVHTRTGHIGTPSSTSSKTTMFRRFTNPTRVEDMIMPKRVQTKHLRRATPMEGRRASVKAYARGGANRHLVSPLTGLGKKQRGRRVGKSVGRSTGGLKSVFNRLHPRGRGGRFIKK